jgi:hypothetical protein
MVLVVSSNPDQGKENFADPDPDPAVGNGHRFEQEAGSGEVKRCCEAQVPHSKVISAVPAMLRYKYDFLIDCFVLNKP